MAQVSGSGWRVVVLTNIRGGSVYLGAEEVLHSLGHRVVGVVTTPGPRKRRNTDYISVVAAVRPGVDVIVTNHMERLAAMIAPLEPDLVISGGFTWLIPPEVIALPRIAAINMHPSLLPRHRGPFAIEWAFRSGDPELGFTIHRLDGAFDTGPILAQHRIPIADEDDAETLVAKLVADSQALLREAVERIARGEPGIPQDESLATYAGAFEDDWRAIDWTRPARHIHNQVRSWTGFRSVPHGAIGEIDGAPHAITRTRLLTGIANGGARHGARIDTTDGRVLIQCGDGALEIVAAAPLDDAASPGAPNSH